MKKIKEIIVVEGKDDISAVKRAVDAEVFQVNGHAVRKNRTVELLKIPYEKKGLIILTDPDYAGEQIRRFLNENFPLAKNAYVPRKNSLKDGDIGIENASPEDIIKALENAKCNFELNENKITTFNSSFLMDYGLIGKENSFELREKLGAELGIGYSNGKQFLSKLNKYNISMEEFKEAYEKIK
ncbi:MAG: ribonuclease M5 [Fusobacteriales bacterium]|nr:MAG: ribonuclease M5 [Fusobacteriales bacterium]